MNSSSRKSPISPTSWRKASRSHRSRVRTSRISPLISTISSVSQEPHKSHRNSSPRDLENRRINQKLKINPFHIHGNSQRASMNGNRKLPPGITLPRHKTRASKQMMRGLVRHGLRIDLMISQIIRALNQPKRIKGENLDNRLILSVSLSQKPGVEDQIQEGHQADLVNSMILYRSRRRPNSWMCLKSTRGRCSSADRSSSPRRT